ncbi:MAG: hypothetical protein ACI9WO_002034 [Sphingobacteriales bacterium]
MVLILILAMEVVLPGNTTFIPHSSLSGQIPNSSVTEICGEQVLAAHNSTVMVAFFASLVNLTALFLKTRCA